MTSKYVCLPQYHCLCYPKGKSVSRNTMLRHRRAANEDRLRRGLSGNLPWGPRETESMSVRAHFQALLHNSLAEGLATETPNEESQQNVNEMSQCLLQGQGGSQSNVITRSSHLSFGEQVLDHEHLQEAESQAHAVTNEEDNYEDAESQPSGECNELASARPPMAIDSLPFGVSSDADQSLRDSTLHCPQGETPNRVGTVNSSRCRSDISDTNTLMTRTEEDSTARNSELGIDSGGHLCESVNSKQVHFDDIALDHEDDPEKELAEGGLRLECEFSHDHLMPIESRSPSVVAIGHGNDSDADRSASSILDLVDDQTNVSEHGRSIFESYEHCHGTEDERETVRTIFASWVKENRVWIDLFYKHNVTQVVMNDILRNINSPYKCWKTVVSRMCRESGIEDAVVNIPICPGHMCFYKNDLTECSVCGSMRPKTDDRLASVISWFTIRGRLKSILRDKTLCKRMYDYFHSTPNEVNGGLCDVFSTDSFCRIANRYGGVEAVMYDVFITVSNDGFQAFDKQTHTIWPIAAIICNFHPAERFHVRNVMPLTFVPGPTEPSDLQSFLGPLIEELKELENDGRGTEILFYDGKRRRVRVHMLCFTGDLPAVKKVSGIKGHNAKFPCRYCVVSEVWSASHRHYYFPSYIRTSEGNRRVFDPSNLPLRTESQSRETIYQLSQMRGQPKAQLQTETGINEGSLLFALPNIVPYRSFPIDIMHLFYNIGKNIIRAWISSRDELYSISKMSLRAIDLELVQYRNGVSSKLGCCPRPLSRFAEWKSAEVKEFILSYSRVVLDGYLPDALLSGWRDVVEVVDICWRTVLTEAEVGKLHVLCLRFYEHFEQYYFRGDVGRVNMCKYTLHLLLHLAECVAECSPPLYYSQYWMERYIGWVLSRMNARNLASSSLFNNAKFVEAYKLLIRDPHETDENQTMTGDYEFRGQCYPYIVGENPNLDDILSACLKSYLIRKYDGLPSAQALQVLESVHEVGFRSRFCFYSENKVQNATTKLVPATLHNMAPRRRENSNVACEMENGRAVDVYYGRLLMLFDFKVDSNLSERWQHWQQSYNVALLDWVSGLEAGTQGQVYKRGRSVDAFGLKTVEDIAIISRLISVVDHVVPSGSSQSRGRHQCYFIDERRLSDNLLRNDQESLNGSQKVLRGMRGENVTFRHT